MVRDILRLPLRAVVASSSATPSSRSAQQLPPRSAAWDAPRPLNSPRAAATAKQLLALISAPFIFISRSCLCFDAGSSTREPGVCSVSGPRCTRTLVRKRREPDAIRFNATLTIRSTLYFATPLRGAGLPAAEFLDGGGTVTGPN